MSRAGSNAATAEALAIYQAAGCRCPDDALEKGIEPAWDAAVQSVLEALRRDPASRAVDAEREYDTGTSMITYVDLAKRPERSMEDLGTRIGVLEVVLSRIAPYAWLKWLESVLEDFLGNGDPIWVGRDHEGPPGPALLEFQDRVERVLSSAGFRLLWPEEMARPMPGHDKCHCCGQEAILENLLFGTDTCRPR